MSRRLLLVAFNGCVHELVLGFNKGIYPLAKLRWATRKQWAKATLLTIIIILWMPPL
jgi:hypothetical protein